MTTITGDPSERWEALRDQLFPRLQDAWDNGGTGEFTARSGHAQWAKFDAGLQIECVSNAFLAEPDQLSFVQRRRLAELGFNNPEPPSWPNYFRRFTEEVELREAAGDLASVILDVLGVDEGEGTQRPRPASSQIAIIVPVGKCDPTVVYKVLEGTAPHITVRQPCTFIDAYQSRFLPRRLDRQPHSILNLGEWLSASTDGSLPDVLTTRAPNTLPEQLIWAAQITHAVQRLRRARRDTLLVGPNYLPGRWLYKGWVREVCDAAILIGDEEGLQLCRDDITDLLRPPLGRTVLTYGSSCPTLPWDASHRHLDQTALEQPFIHEVAVAVRVLWELGNQPRV